jgi:serine/threonine-protein kinase HipA
LAPAYDICHAFRPGSEWVSQHALSINNKRKNITRQDLLLVGEAIHCKKAASIITEISEVVNQWKKHAKVVGVNPKLIRAIDDTILKRI